MCTKKAEGGSMLPLTLPGRTETFGQELQRHRLDAKVSVQKQAKELNVNKRLYRAWENDQAVPGSLPWRRLIAWRKDMCAWGELISMAHKQGLTDLPRKQKTNGTPETHEEIEAEIQKMAFPLALRTLRVEEGITQSELASLVGVTPPTIRKWECGDMTPVEENYDKLESLFPKLPKPSGVRDIPKPIGAEGHTHEDMGWGRKKGTIAPPRQHEPRLPRRRVETPMAPTPIANATPSNGVPPAVKWATALAKVAGCQEHELFADAVKVADEHKLSTADLARLYEVIVSDHFSAFSELVALSPSVGVNLETLTNMIKGDAKHE